MGLGITASATLVLSHATDDVPTRDPGDLVFYGSFPHSHVTVYIGNGLCVSHGNESGPVFSGTTTGRSLRSVRTSPRWNPSQPSVRGAGYLHDGQPTRAARASLPRHAGCVRLILTRATSIL